MGHDGGPETAMTEAPATRIIRMTDPALAGRYAWLADLVAPRAGDRVVDLGCGESPVLDLVLPRLDGGTAVGIDNDLEALAAARSPTPTSGPRTLFLQADLTEPLPLADGSMDVVFSHDVLELLPDPDALLDEAYRVLRPGGRLVLGHADFDTAVFAGADIQLTRRLVHAYCDTQQSWMPRAEGTIGRRLPEIVLRSPLTLDDVTARVLLTRSLEEGGFGRFAIDHFIRALSEAGAASPRELAGWRTELEAADARAAFLLSLNDYVVLASRP
jgi:SAM-dependent methyltransferase